MFKFRVLLGLSLQKVQTPAWVLMPDLTNPETRIALTERAWESVGGPTLCEDCYKNGFESGLYHRTLYGVDILELPEHTIDWRVGYKQGRNLKVEGWPLPRLKKDRVPDMEGDSNWTPDQGQSLAGMKVLCLSATEDKTLQEVWEDLKAQMLEAEEEQ